MKTSPVRVGIVVGVLGVLGLMGFLGAGSFSEPPTKPTTKPPVEKGDLMKAAESEIKYLFIPPRKASSGKAPVLVALHGVGSNEKDLASWAETLDPRFAIYSLRGPLELGPDSFAWFHVKFTAEGPLHNKEEAESSRQLLRKFLETLRQDPSVEASQIFLVGFSQGTIMGLSLVLTEPSSVAGLVAIGGRTLQEISAQARTRTYEKSPKVLLIHGAQDNKLPLSHALATEATLKGARFDFEFKTYEAGHEINRAMTEDIQKWLASQI